jgi:hypothetical protein
VTLAVELEVSEWDIAAIAAAGLAGKMKDDFFVGNELQSQLLITDIALKHFKRMRDSFDVEAVSSMGSQHRVEESHPGPVIDQFAGQVAPQESKATRDENLLVFVVISLRH